MVRQTIFSNITPRCKSDHYFQVEPRFSTKNGSPGLFFQKNMISRTKISSGSKFNSVTELQQVLTLWDELWYADASICGKQVWCLRCNSLLDEPKPQRWLAAHCHPYLAFSAVFGTVIPISLYIVYSWTYRQPGTAKTTLFLLKKDLRYISCKSFHYLIQILS